MLRFTVFLYFCIFGYIQLIIAEAEPGLSGHRLASELANSSNISVTLVPDSGVFALMSRVNKVCVYYAGYNHFREPGYD